MKTSQKVLTVLATATAFVVLFKLNDIFFSSLQYSKGAGWIFLPSGMRLVFVLIFVQWGAVGISLGSIAIGIQYFNGDYLSSMVAGCISGLSPLWARKLCIELMHVNTDLSALEASDLLKMAFVFSILSSVLHQIWYSIHGETVNFIGSAIVMMIGDLMGTLVVLYVAKTVWGWFGRSA